MRRSKEEIISGAGTFIVDIKCRENNTWQGTVNWVEKNETRSFRSMLEMIGLMNSALEAGTPGPGQNMEDAGMQTSNPADTVENGGADE